MPCYATASTDPPDREQGLHFFRAGIVHELAEDPLEVDEGIRTAAAHLFDEEAAVGTRVMDLQAPRTGSRRRNVSGSIAPSVAR